MISCYLSLKNRAIELILRCNSLNGAADTDQSEPGKADQAVVKMDGGLQHIVYIQGWLEIHVFPAFTVYIGGMGEWTSWYENGSLKYSIHYKAGEFHGEKILLSSSGEVVNVEFYENGVLMEQD